MMIAQDFPQNSTALSCSGFSQSVDEQIYGTAPRTDSWFLLEYPYPIGSKAFEMSPLPDPVKARINAALKKIPFSRLLLIKRADNSNPDQIRLFIALSQQPNQPALYELQFDSYSDLATLDLSGLPQKCIEAGNQLDDPIYLVCTNGKRDPCCARYGLPAYRALSESAPMEVWECSHVGGHRFAANVIRLPEGLYYGRINEYNASRLVEASRRGQVLVEHLRGRSTYTPEQQAAEYYLIRDTGNLGIGAFQLLGSQETGVGQWRVYFKAIQAQHMFELEIGSQETEFGIFESCSKPDVRTPQTQYRLNRIIKS